MLIHLLTQAMDIHLPNSREHHAPRPAGGRLGQHRVSLSGVREGTGASCRQQAEGACWRELPGTLEWVLCGEWTCSTLKAGKYSHIQVLGSRGGGMAALGWDKACLDLTLCLWLELLPLGWSLFSWSRCILHLQPALSPPPGLGAHLLPSHDSSATRSASASTPPSWSGSAGP